MEVPTLELDCRLVRGGGEAAWELRAQCWLEGPVSALLGPTGAGKSALVEAIAGHLRPREGRIAVRGQVLFDHAGGVWVPPELRGLGWVPKEPAIFPHLSVLRGIAFPASDLRGYDADECVALFKGLNIAPLVLKRAGELTATERRRVALARALVRRPRLLLLDETLGAFDAAPRGAIGQWLREYCLERDIRLLVVTDGAEAARLADDAALITPAGQVVTGEARELARRVNPAAYGPILVPAAPATLPS